MDRLKLSPQHWAAVATFIASIATMIGGLEHGWHDALSTTFVAGVLMQVTAIIQALAAGSMTERDPDLKERRTDRGVGV